MLHFICCAFIIVFILWLLVALLICLDQAFCLEPDDASVIRWVCIFIPSFFKKWFNYRYIIKKDKIPCFSAKQIITFEKTAPAKWEVVKNTYATFRPWEIYYCGSLVGVKTIFGYWKVIFYLKNRDKIHKRNSDSLEYDKNLAVLLADFQKDAENASKEAEKTMKEKEQEIINILNQLQKTSQSKGKN